MFLLSLIRLKLRKLRHTTVIILIAVANFQIQLSIIAEKMPIGLAINCIASSIKRLLLVSGKRKHSILKYLPTPRLANSIK